MTGRRVAQIVAGIAAIAALSLLFFLSQPPDETASVRIVAELRGIRETEETISRLALEARMGRLHTYDPIVAAEHRIDRLVGETAQDLEAAGYPGRDELERYKSDVATRRALIARFESADAIYRNANAYFPVLARRILGSAAVAGRPEAAAAIADWEQVVFLRRAGRADDDAVSAAEARLRATSVGDDATAADLEALRTHGRALVTAYDAAGELVGGILDADRGDQPNAIYHAYAQRSSVLEERAHRMTYALYAAAFLSVIGIVISFLRMGRATARLNTANGQLAAQAADLARAQRIAGVGSYVKEFVGDSGAMSAECRKILGVSDDYVVDRAALLALVHAEDRDRVTEVWRRLRDGTDSLHVEHRIVRPDGGVRWIRSEAELIRDASGAAIGVAGTLHDINDLHEAQVREVELERQLQHSQKLEALGTLAGGIAHDLNNTLVPILSLTKMTQKRLPENSRERDNLGTVLVASERARDLVKQILLFSRKEEPIMQAVDLSGVVREAMRMMRPSLPATIEIVDLIAETPPLHGDAGQLLQVTVNLVTNAAQAIGRAPGRITVAVTAERSSAAPAGTVCLSVADTGCGINPLQLARIFEPFFTTKPINEGTGLGLSVVHGIVTKHGGRINVQSALGQGTVFTVVLPAADAKASAVSAEATAA